MGAGATLTARPERSRRLRIDHYIRVFLALGVALALLLTLIAAFFVTESAFAVWDRLQTAPTWLLVLYAALVGGVTVAAGWLVWRLLRPRRRPAAPAADEDLSADALADRLAAAEAAGVDVARARAELERWHRRRDAGRVHVAMFGQISTGKSSLIRALLPEEAGTDIVVSVRGGSTRETTDYVWRSPAGDELMLTDVPGLNETAGSLDGPAREEAVRAHVVVFVCDGDLTRDEMSAIDGLDEYEKPMVVAVNKADRYTAAQLDAIRGRVRERVGAQVPVVAISAAPVEQVVRVDSEGRETRQDRVLPPRVDDLKRALQGLIDDAPEALEQLRDASVFLLASRKLDAAQAAFRAERTDELVRSYTRRAVVGALAAVAPGMDIVIQGYLGTAMVRELCELYDVPVRDLDTDKFLKLSQRHVGKAVPLLLAVAGNGLKAFPGVGTIGGGLMHAVAYGLIFDALGRSLGDTLAAGGGLRPAPAAALFKEKLGEDLQARTRQIARLALAPPADDDRG